MRKRYLVLSICLLCLLCGCSIKTDDEEKIRDIDFTVVDKQEIPEELEEFISEQGKEAFEITFGDEGYLYIVKGYGRQESTGYSIEVEECYETSALIHIRTTLHGPSKGEDILEKETFPYIVIKIEYSEKNVVFE